LKIIVGIKVFLTATNNKKEKWSISVFNKQVHADNL
jgi:hypothetical protein